MFLSNSSFSYSHSMNTYGSPSSFIHEEININPASFLEFTTPFLANDDDPDHFLLSDLSHLLSQQQQILGLSNSGEMVMDGRGVATNVITVSSTGHGKKRSCKRSSGKDRHSKIYTAQGPRDRRMRLSLPIARKFFDLQDMLGFDKPSKTIEWLFSKSKAAIKDLTTCAAGAGGWSVSSTSESEVMSISKMSSTTHDGEVDVGDGESCGNVVVGEEKIMKSKKVAKQGLELLQTKELRDNARARARERTMEKMKTKPNFGFYCSQEMNEAPSHDGLLGHQMDSVNIMEKLLGTASTISARSSNFNCRTTENIGISRSAGKKSMDVMIPENWGSIYNDSYYCALTNTKPSPGNANDDHHQVQNPSAIFVSNPNCQPQNPNLNSPVQNPNSVVYPSFSEQNPAGYYPGLTSSEIVLHSDLQFLQQENHFSGNYNFHSKYGCLY